MELLSVLSKNGAWATRVSAGGTPRVALALTSATTVILILTGTFDQIVSLAAVLFLLNYLSAYAAMFVLRRREPNAPRPYRAIGFPATTAIVLLGSILFEIAAIADDWRYGVVAGLIVVGFVLLYLVIRRGVFARKTGRPL